MSSVTMAEPARTATTGISANAQKDFLGLTVESVSYNGFILWLRQLVLPNKTKKKRM